MICQNCKEKNAAVHIKTIAGGKLTEYYLCGDCAKEKGYGNVFESFESDFGALLGGLFGAAAASGTKQPVERCAACGSSFADIKAKGKIGCANCYDKFRDQLLPMIQRIHGEAKHKGKQPGGSSALRIQEPNQLAVTRLSELDDKKARLKKAIEEQNFEEAAVLRDEIRALKQPEE